MKRLISIPVLSVLFAACGAGSPNIEGRYVTTNESSASIATETLTIEKTAKDGKDMYTIRKEVTYARKSGVQVNGKDSLGKWELKPAEFLTGRYDAGNHVLTVPDLKNPFIVKDGGKTLTLGDAIYRKQ